MLKKLRDRNAPPTGFNSQSTLAEPQDVYVETENGRYSCHAFDSPNGKWTLAYGLRASDESSTLFRLKNEEVDFSTSANRPADGSIANDGTLAVSHHGTSETRVEGFRIIVDDKTTVDRTLDVAISDIAVRPDGDAVSLTTRQPDASVHTYNANSGEEMWSYSLRGETPRLLGYHGERNLLFIARTLREDPYLALDADGDVVWGSSRYQTKRSLSERIRAFLGRD